MSEQNPELDIESLSSEEFTTQSILRRLPNSRLEIHVTRTNKIFEIYVDQRLLLKIDKRGVKYCFPSRRKRNIKWETTPKTALPRTIDYILRDLAQADYDVLSPTNKPLAKRPMHISRFTRCPICKEKGGVKVILRTDTVTEENSEIYTPVSRSMDINGAEMKCTLCGWMGIREELNRRARIPRD
jgi:hypothetical protein